MNNSNHSIERNVKLIATVGALLLLVFAVTLIIVQNRLGESQARLTSTIVPALHELGELTAAVGDMYLRQNEIVSANAVSIQRYANREREESAVRDNRTSLTLLLSHPTILDHASFPREAMQGMQHDVDEFLQADTALFRVAVEQLQIQSKFQQAVLALENDLKKLMNESAGAAGILRLEYMASLRKIHQQLANNTIVERDLMSAITGDARAQMATISELDTSVLQLGVLAGKVGLAASPDAMNSLVANELNQNRQQIQDALQKLIVFTGDSKIASRIATIRDVAMDLADRVGNEMRSDSLASLRREVLRQNAQVLQIKALAADSASNLNSQIAALSNFTETLAAEANASAASTIWNSRLATAIISVVGLVLTCTSGLRVRQSLIQLRQQNASLEELSAQLAATNSSLEATVAERTASLQMILDNTGEGVLSVNLNGRLLPERSATVTRWCGRAQSGSTLWDYLGAEDADFAGNLEMAFTQMAEQIFPFEVAAAQAPDQFSRHGRTFSLGFREIQENGSTSRFLVIIRDITRQLEAERAEKEARELHKLIANLLRDRSGFHQHLDECATLIDSIRDNRDSATVNRTIHTIKGTTAILGLQRVSEWIHHLESTLAMENRLPSEGEYQVLCKLWRDSLANISDYLTVDRSNIVELNRKQLDELKSLACETEIAEQINQLIEYWNFEPVATHLNRLAKYSQQVAQRLDKKLQVVVEDDLVRIPPNSLNSFWASLVHVVRNAIDHGIELPLDRLRYNKPESGVIKLLAKSQGDLLEVQISDDGRGIDWQRVSQKAQKLGLPVHSHEELIEALFHDGFSTSEHVTELSGRGVGLSAVKEACLTRFGKIRVHSEPGQGATFRFSFSIRALTEFAVSQSTKKYSFERVD